MSIHTHLPGFSQLTCSTQFVKLATLWPLSGFTSRMSDESRLHEILEEDCIEDEEDGGREAECRWHGEDPGEKNA